MADFKSSLPIRSEADADERVQVKIADGSTPTQLATVSTTGEVSTFVHGSDAGTETPIHVDSAGDLQVDVLTMPTVTVTATDLDIRDLTHVSDSVKVGDGTDFLAIAADGSIAVTDNGGSLTVDATDFDIRNLLAASDKVMAHGSDDGGTTARALKTDANGVLEVAFSASPAGDEVHDYNTSSAVAKDATTNHDYTVTALRTLGLKSIWASGSGRMKIEIIEDPLGTPDTLAVGFNSTSSPNISMPFDPGKEYAAGTLIRITITNRDSQPQDVYSTLVGTERA